MKSISILMVCMLLTACESTPRITTRTEIAPDAEFSRYRSYIWITRPQSDSSLERQRIVADIDAQLHSRGWVESDKADVAVVAQVATTEKQSTEPFYSQGVSQGWGLRPGTDGRVDSPMPPRVSVRIDKVGSLAVDMFDANTHQEVWRGVAEIKIVDSPERLNAAIDAGIVKLFSSFPVVSQP